MKKRMMSVVGVAVAIVTVSAFGESSDAPCFLSPNGTAMLTAIHTDAQKTFLSKSMEDRRAYATTAAGREAMRTEATGRWPNAEQPDNQYAKKTSGTFPQWVTLTWTGDGPFTVEVFRKADDKLFFSCENLCANSVDVFNCELDTEYVWRVSNAAGVSETATFKTDNVFPRLLWDHDELGQIYGVRDLGGAKGRHGLVVKQGLIIRSSEPMKGATSYATDAAFWTGTALDGLGIRYELDLRSAEQTGYATASGFGDGVIYNNNEINSYQDIFEADETAAFKAALDVALNPENYPLNFHGEIGMDRTGSLALVLEALLGMSKDDIMRDYESSWFWYKPNGRPMDEAYNQIDRLLTCVENFDGSTFNAKVASYCFSIGVTQAQLDAFRTAMLGEGGAAPTEDDASIARGDVDFVTLPTGMTGYGYAVSNLTAGAEIRPDNEDRYALPIGAKVGIYAVAEAGYAIVGTNPYVIDEVTIDTVIDASALPMALPPRVVTLGDHPHLTVAWTSGDGSVTNAVDGKDFPVTNGTTNVKVVFTAESDWEIVGDAVVELGTVTEDITFGEESGYEVPGVRLLPVSYVDAAGEVQTKAGGDFDIVTEETRLLTNGWYAVLNDVAIPAGAHLTVQGDAHLILCDGASLTVADPGDHAAGIAVVDANRLTIYGQEAGTGVLTAQGGEYCAGIGGFADGSGRDEPDCGTVTIIGGTVVATGGLGAAGIGCSPMGRGGHVAIHGGTVTATSGLGGTGIGCCEDILVPPKDGSEVVITGGKVSASGLRYDIHQKDIHFASVSISGGVFIRRPEDGWCAEHFTVFDNPDPETRADYPYAVLPSFMVTVGECPAHVSAAWTSGEGKVTNAIVGTSFAVPQGADAVRVIFAAETDWELVGEAEVWLDTVTDDIVFGAGNDYRVPTARYLLGDIPYLDWDGTQMTNAALPKYVFTFVTDRTRELTSGWYAVTNDIVFPMGANLVVNGSAHLVLCDGASLTITNSGMNSAAVAVPTGASLTIYGQEAGTGELVAMGGCDSAGIGGFADWDDPSRGNCGAVTINGGTVTAQGGENAAGIGGGYATGEPSYSTGDVITYSDGGVVTINGGMVTATGGGGILGGGAGIGGGYFGAGGVVTIAGGAVKVVGGVGAEDIGHGYGSHDSGGICISGGIFAQMPQDDWLKSDHSVITNQDAVTAAAYPWAVVQYPAAWPAADEAVKAKFKEWRTGAGAGVDLSTDDAQKAFLLNVGVTGIKELRIESIEVDAEGYATIVVSAPGAFFFDRIHLGNINGVLYVHAGDTLETMTPKAVAYWTTTSDKAVIKVRENFIRAVIGFKTPDAAADTLQPEQGAAK